MNLALAKLSPFPKEKTNYCNCSHDMLFFLPILDRNDVDLAILKEIFCPLFRDKGRPSQIANFVQPLVRKRSKILEKWREF